MSLKRPLKYAPAVGIAGLVGLGISTPAWAVNLLLHPSVESPADPPGDNQNFVARSPINDGSRATFANPAPGGTFGLWAKCFQPAGGGVTQTLTGIQAGQPYDFSSFM